MTYPFELVYREISRRILTGGLPDDGGDLPPVLILATVEGGEVVEMTPSPAHQFMESAGTKNILGLFINTIVPRLPPNTCLALVSESYVRTLNTEDGEDLKAARAKLPDSLADDPLAQEVVAIHLYRPDDYRMGCLKILPGRKLEYQPLTPPPQGVEGRLAVGQNGSRPIPSDKAGFVDAQEMERLHPATFEAPTADELDELRPGMHAKVCTAGEGGERFWVKIDTIEGNTLTGKVDNDLVRTHAHGWKHNDVVTFERRHVYQTHK